MEFGDNYSPLLVFKMWLCDRMRKRQKVDESAYYDKREKIKRLENELKTAAATANLGSPAFSEYYDGKVAEINKLQKEVKEIERSWNDKKEK